MDIRYRPATSDDLPYAYGLFKRLTRDAVCALTDAWAQASGMEERKGWPEQPQYEFFRQGFANPDTKILMAGDRPIGCFCLTETGEVIKLQRMYVEPDMQGHGIGSAIIKMGIEKAHEAQKPLELEVLKSNRDSVIFYQKRGFIVYDETSYDWVREWVMRHRDTDHCAFRPNRSGGQDFTP